MSLPKEPSSTQTLTNRPLDAALKLYFALLEFFFPTSAEQTELLMRLLRENSDGELSDLEGQVLSLLMKRYGDPKVPPHTHTHTHTHAQTHRHT
jgi:hypothetical protein